MSTIPSFTKYYVSPKTVVCTGTCPDALPHYKDIGKKAGKCPACGGILRRIKEEPYGTQHSA